LCPGSSNVRSIDLVGTRGGLGLNRPILTITCFDKPSRKAGGVHDGVKKASVSANFAACFLLDGFPAIAQRRGRSPLGEFSLGAPLRGGGWPRCSLIARAPHIVLWDGGIRSQESAAVRRLLSQGHVK